MCLHRKVLFGKELSLDQLLASEKRLSGGNWQKAVSANESLRRFHEDYSHSVGAISSILFFPKGAAATHLEPTVLQRLKTPQESSRVNPFTDFFTQFFRVSFDDNI